MEIEEKIIKKETLFKGNIFDVRRDTVILPNGMKATRDNLEHCGACAVFAVTNDNKLVLVKQYRSAIFDVTTELPAGKLDKGNEDRMEAAMRELEEETGYKAGKMVHYFDILSAVGYCDEVISVYLATNLKRTKQNLDDDEFLNVVEIDIKEFKESVLKGEIRDAKTVAGVMRYCLENNI